MIRAEKDAVRVSGDHLKELFLMLRKNEDALSPENTELANAVQNVLFETLSIEEVEKLTDDVDTE